MTPSRDLTDDDLEQLLRDAFVAKESLADVDAAHRIATTTPAPRRVWPAVVGVAAAVAVIAGAGIGIARSTTGSPTAGPAGVVNGGEVPHVQFGPSTPLPGPTSGAPLEGPVAGPLPGAKGCGVGPGLSFGIPGLSVTESARRATTDAGNEAATQDEVVDLLDQFSATMGSAAPGTERLTSSPTSELASQTTYVSPSDPSFTQTQWWMVPLTVRHLEAYLACNPVDGELPPSTWGGTTDGKGGTLPETTYRLRSGDSYTSPYLTLTLQPVDGGTAVRADTFIAARRGRTAQSYVTELPQSVDVTGLPGGPFHVTDPTKIDDITMAFDDLGGIGRHLMAESCPPSAPGYSPPDFTVTFHTSHGDVVAHQQDGECRTPLISVSRGGALLTPFLDGTTTPSDGGSGNSSFMKVVEGILGATQ